MNYGWDETAANWKEDRKGALVKALSERLPCPVGWTPGGKTPYLEVDRLYSGVRIRKLTNLADEDLDGFVKRADAIYQEVMSG
jgi:hypothetical protein